MEGNTKLLEPEIMKKNQGEFLLKKCKNKGEFIINAKN